ncbi:tudor domain-containing protein 1 [Chanos chanos]|uniref:Tudor domain-containing protein 1 n=1 Tax=Chanos chanos TaxID=29144 RepID=A0A6J2VGJ9_CHACN|nr:tudor domain-containing protein 1 [Chanos chanos]
MDRTFCPALVGPNLPLRRPATGPGGMSLRNHTQSLGEAGTSVAPGRPLSKASGDGQTSVDGVTLSPAGVTPTRTVTSANPLILKLCNFCGQQGNLRCTRCKKTCYCSVSCQTQDWKAHSHICKPTTSEAVSAEKLKECSALDSANAPPGSDSQVHCQAALQPKRVYVSDLPKTDLTRGAEVQASVLELTNPGKFFIRIHSVEMMEAVRNIAVRLHKMHGGSASGDYTPETGEICAVKYSVDQNWYRGEIKRVHAESGTATVLYIDFGNEESVTFDKIKALAAKVDSIPPCALQCRVAGVAPVTSAWPDECVVAMRRLVAGESLRFTVVERVENGSVFTVDSRLPALGKTLSSFLIDCGYAFKEGSPQTRHKEQDIDSLLLAAFENFKRFSGGRIENWETQAPEPMTQEVGDTFFAVVTHLQSPSEMMCQKLDNAGVIQELQMKLREHCAQTPPCQDFRPAPGTICCSLFSEDKQWYRAKVLAYSSETRVRVGYVDFGNCEEVQLDCLRPISVELLALPTQAIPCALAGIKPSADRWSEEPVLMLRHLVCNRFLRVEIRGVRAGVALVEMVDETTDPQTAVAELLVSLGYAVGETPAPKKLAWSCAELPTDGQKVVLVVGVVESPAEFYCYHCTAEGMRALAELSAELMHYCETDRNAFSPAVGDPCCALFTGDGRWYRAVVQAVWGEGKATVHFVDYGNSCEVDTANLRAMPPPLLAQPFHAIRCVLAGVDPAARCWTDEANQRFRSLCVGQQLSGRVLAISERGYAVELESGGQSVASLLISEQLAKATGHDPAQSPSQSTNQRGQQNDPAQSPAQSPNQRGQQNDPAQSPAQSPNQRGQQNDPAQSPVKSTNQLEVLRAQSPFAAVLNQAPSEAQLDGISSSETDSSGLSETAVPPEELFPADWETVVLPCNQTFQPLVAAVSSPALFYLMSPGKVNVEQLQAVMIDVAKHCQRVSPALCPPLPGTACCAQFTGDKNWYRAVVLDATDTHVNVIYADYGNMENVPLSNIKPISKQLLKAPFQIVRCALSEKDQFPVEWPLHILELFRAHLSGRVLASVQAFDGTSNLLTMTQHTGQDDNHINAIILGALTGSRAVSTAGELDQVTETLESKAPETEPVTEMEKQAEAGSDWQTHGRSKADSAPSSDCCCLQLKKKVDRIEELILLILKNTGGTSA